MDAISFVLGVRSMYLRSNDKTDFIYRGRRLARAPDDPSQPDDDDDDAEDPDRATSAWVMAVYIDQDGHELKFKRTYVNFGS
jgi:structural maintenance of chromosome 1